MKLRYFLTSIIACLALAIGCTQEELPALSEIQVTPSYFTFGVDGGAKTLTVVANDKWEVVDVPEWLNVTPASGEATGAEGVKVTVTAAATTAEKIVTATFKIKCAGETQLITVGQEAYVPDYPKFEAGEYWIMFGEEVALPVSGAYGYLYTAKASKSDDGKLTSTADNIFKFIAVDGGFNIQDANGMYYYMKGTYDSFNVDASPVDGSVWTVQQTGDNTFKLVNASNGKVMQYDPAYSSAGAYSSDRSGAIYPNLVNTAGNEIAEIMFAVEPTEVEVEKEAGVFNINMTCKNDGFEIKPSVSWITVQGMTSTNGEYVVTFSYEANEGTARTATIDFVSGEETITVEVSQAGGVLEGNIAAIIAAGANASAKTSGVIVAKYNRGALIYDGTGYILVYKGSAITEVVGDKIEVVGPTSVYGGMLQFGNATEITKVSSGNNVSHPSPTVLDGAGMEAQLAKTSVEYIEYVGTLSVSGNYYNVAVEGTSAALGSLQYIDASAFPAAVDGAQIKVRGYFIGVSSGKYINTMAVVVVDSNEDIEEPEKPESTTLTLTNAEICAAMTSSETSYQNYTIESASGVWTVNASRNNANTFLQCRGKKGAYIQTPLFENEIKSVTIHFSEAKKVYANNVYCVFPSTWTAPTEDAAYPEDGNVGRAVTDGSYSLTIPVEAGNKQVYISIIGTYAYYLDHIDVNF